MTELVIESDFLHDAETAVELNRRVRAPRRRWWQRRKAGR
jgi:hypothetical protein